MFVIQSDGRHNSINKFERDILMKEVAHGANKYALVLLPFEWLVQNILMYGWFKSVLILIGDSGVRVVFHSIRELLGVAMLTPLANFCASGYWVPHLGGPFYFSSCHGLHVCHKF